MTACYKLIIMEFTGYFETTNDYEPTDVVTALHKALERGAEQLKEVGNDYTADIIFEIINNSPQFERE